MDEAQIEATLRAFIENAGDLSDAQFGEGGDDSIEDQIYGWLAHIVTQICVHDWGLKGKGHPIWSKSVVPDRELQEVKDRLRDAYNLISGTIQRVHRGD